MSEDYQVSGNYCFTHQWFKKEGMAYGCGLSSENGKDCVFNTYSVSGVPMTHVFASETKRTFTKEDVERNFSLFRNAK